MIRYVLILAFLGVVVGAGVMTARGYYCRDPDTGKLYPVNASWQSTTFCGSYTCKIRKRNITDIKYMPWRQMNFTKDFKQNASTIYSASKGNPDVKPTFTPCNKMTPVEYVTPVDDVITTDNNIDVEIENRTKGEILDILHKKVANTSSTLNKLKVKCNKNNIDENDRYLTEDEIKVLIDILHSIKKSDLIALVEMYNLAQNVYNELDTSATENVAETNEEYKDDLKNVNEGVKEKEAARRKTSYWYEPLAVPVNKHKGELDIGKENIVPSLEEMSPSIVNKNMDLVDNSNTNSITVPPNPNLVKSNKDSNIYLGAPLSKEDFRMLPYFYPISTFQRLSSYVNPNVQFTPNTKAANIIQEQQVQMQQLFQANLLQSLLRKDLRSTVPQTAQTFTPSFVQNTQPIFPIVPTPNNLPQTKILTSLLPSKTAQKNILQLPDSEINLLAGYKPHCKHEASHLQYLHAHPSWFNRIVKKPFMLDTKNHLLDPVSIYIPKEKTIAHLPYPLNYLDNMNTSHQRTKNSEPWAILDFMKSKQGPSYVKAAYIAHLPNTLVINPVIEESNDLQQMMREKKLVGDKDDETDTKGSLLDALKSINSQKIQHRKKVRLEKVGKLLKLDTLLRKRRDAVETKKGETRSNGSSETVEEFEVYLDRSMCDSDTSPGFFRMGNLTEPFPACCPQRIGSKR